MTKTSNIYFVLFIIGIVALACSCNPGTKWNDLEFYRVEKMEQITEKPVSDDEDIAALRDSDECNIDVAVDMQFITTNNEEIEDICRIINEHLIEIVLKQSGKLSVEEAIDNFVSERKKDLSNNAYGPELYEHTVGRAEYGSTNIITYRVETSSYLGGAHPYTGTTILTFNALTGEYIELASVFPTIHHPSIAQLLTNKLIKQLGKSTLSEIQEEGYLDMIDMFVSTNFALREDSVEFYYNPYDIAPYACGPTSICLSYDEVKPFISTSFEDNE